MHSLCKEQKNAVKCQARPMSFQYAAQGEYGGKIHSVQYDSMVTTLFLCLHQRTTKMVFLFWGQGIYCVFVWAHV